MIEIKKCPLCGSIDEENEFNNIDGIVFFDCKKRCRGFSITQSLFVLGTKFELIKNYGYILSGISREKSEAEENPPKFTDEKVIGKLLEEPKFKELEEDSYTNKSKIFLEHIHLKCKPKGLGHYEYINLDNDYPLAYARNWGEFNELIKDLLDKSFLKRSLNEQLHCIGIRITQEGIEYLKELPGSSEKEKPKKLLVDIQYVDESSISELENIKSCGYDFTRLVQMLKELNITYNSECYISVALLVRAIIDHIPPFFNMKNFSEVANNYGEPKKDKSFKDLMKHLDDDSRKIADMFLHTQIRKTENLPTKTQVNFSPSLETLLGEIIRVCKEKEKNP